MNDVPDLSFVIPARNEDVSIGNAIESIGRALSGSGLVHDVLVVDNGSTDATAERAMALGARVLARPDVRTIACLRNEGAAAATGAVLVFIDADVTLDRGWGAAYAPHHARLAGGARWLTGSEVLCPDDSTWIERTWFGVQGKDRSHINSGHLVAGREAFLALGGFDAGLVSGEDYELSQRARAAGWDVAAIPELRAFHHGYPRTVGSFFRREVWHGMGDFDWAGGRTVSRTGQVTIANLLVLALAIAAALGWHSPWPLVVPLASMLALSALATAVRPKRRWSDAGPVMFLYGVYFTARACSAAAAVKRVAASRGARVRRWR